MLLYSVYIAILSTAFPVIYGLVSWKKLLPSVKVLVVHCCISLGFDMASMTQSFMGQSNTLLMSLFTLLNFGVLGLYFSLDTQTSRFKNYFLIYYSILLLFIFGILFIFNDPEDDKIFFAVSGWTYIGLIPFVLHSFYCIIEDALTAQLHHNYKFFIGIGILLHLSGSSLLFFVPGHVSSMDYQLLWIIFKCGMQIIMNILIVTGIYKSLKYSHGV